MIWPKRSYNGLALSMAALGLANVLLLIWPTLPSKTPSQPVVDHTPIVFHPSRLKPTENMNSKVLIQSPLFRHDRLPLGDMPPIIVEKIKEDTDAKPPVFGDYKLIGVIFSQQQRMIFLFNKTTKTELLLREGDGVEGWMVTQIMAHSATFSQANHIHKIKIEDHPAASISTPKDKPRSRRHTRPNYKTPILENDS